MRREHEDRKEESSCHGIVRAFFNFYFILKLSFNVFITLSFQKITIGVEKKSSRLISRDSRYRLRKFGLIANPVSTNSYFIPEVIIE